MSKFDCSKNCKKTAQMRVSKYCTGEATISDGKILFGCDEKISCSSAKEINFNNCLFWDAGIDTQCISCNLVCDKNKNENIKNIKSQKDIIKSMLDVFGPMAAMNGQSTKNINDMSGKLNDDNFNPNNLAEVVQITNYAKTLLEAVVSGKKVDLAEFNSVKDHVIKKYKKIEE